MLFFAKLVWKVSSLKSYTSNNTTKHDTTQVQHDTTQIKHDTTRVQYDATRVQHDPAQVQRSSGSKNRALLLTNCYWTIHWLWYCFNSLNTKGAYMPYIRPSDMLLSNQGRITSCTKLNGQPDIKRKIVIQLPKMYLFFRVLSTTTTTFENLPLATKQKSRIMLSRCLQMYFKHFFTCLKRTSKFIISIFRTI